MGRGAFVTIEGIEGVGKSTCLEYIGRRLARRGIEYLVTREPGGTPLGEHVREWVLHGQHGRLSAEVEALLMFAARAEHLDKLIRPTLADGVWVVCDRFTDATFAYQGGGRAAPRSLLECLRDGVQRGLTPDLTLLLDAPVETGLARIGGRERDHFEREERAFFERVRAAYLALAGSEPGRVRIVDADRPIEAVEAQIGAELDAFAERFARLAP